MTAAPWAALALSLACATGAQAAAARPAPTPPAADRPLHVTVIDAEGGSATLFVTPEGQSLLVDTGWPPTAVRRGPQYATADRIVAAAQKLGLTRIDYLLLSHYHGDHIGGFLDLVGKFPVGTFVDHGDNRETVDFAGQPSGAPADYQRYLAAIRGKPHRVVKAGETMDIGSMRLTFVTSDRAVIQSPLPGASGTPTPGCGEAGEKADEGGEENPRSAGFVATFGQARILDLSDLTWNVEKTLVCPTDKIGPVDLMIVSHHGSQLSNSPPLLAAVRPRVALVPNGPQKGGDASVLQTLRAAPSHPIVWQAHSATRSPNADRPDHYLANLAGQTDAGYTLEADVWRDGVIAVTNPRLGFTERYYDAPAAQARR